LEPKLNAGTMTTDLESEANLDSMADMIDKEFDKLLKADQLTGLSFDMTERMVRDRRRLFVAIARGVVMHLVNKNAVFAVTVEQLPATVEPNIQMM